METPDILNSKAVKAFIKGSLVLIGLFFVLSCGVAVLLFPFDKNLKIAKNFTINNTFEIANNLEVDKNFENVNNLENSDNLKNKARVLILVLIIPLIFLFIFFIILFFRFSGSVKCYYTTLCVKHKETTLITQKNEETCFKKHIIDKLSELFISTVKVIDSNSDKLSELCLSKTKVVDSESDKLRELYLSAVDAIDSKSENTVSALQEILKEILKQLSEICSVEKKECSENVTDGGKNPPNSKSNTDSCKGAVVGSKYICYVCPETK